MVRQMDIIIRRPKNDDIVNIKDLFSMTVEDNFRKEGLLDTLKDEMNKEVSDLTDSLKKDLETDGASDYYLLAIVENIIVGTIAYGRPNNIIRSHMGISLDKIPEIKSVYILPEYQKRGIGSLLFREVIECLNQLDITSFCLDCGYKKSQPFWEKQLGKAQKTLLNYWAEGSHHKIWYKKVEEFLY